MYVKKKKSLFFLALIALVFLLVAAEATKMGLKRPMKQRRMGRLTLIMKWKMALGSAKIKPILTDLSLQEECIVQKKTVPLLF